MPATPRYHQQRDWRKFGKLNHCQELEVIVGCFIKINYSDCPWENAIHYVMRVRECPKAKSIGLSHFSSSKPMYIYIYISRSPTMNDVELACLI